MRILVIGAGTGARMRKAADAANIRGAETAIELEDLGARSARAALKLAPVGAVLVVGPLWSLSASGSAAQTRAGVQAAAYLRGGYKVFAAPAEGKRGVELREGMPEPPTGATAKRKGRIPALETSCSGS